MNEYSLPFKFKLPTIDQIFQSISHCRNYSESIIKISVYNVKKKKKRKRRKKIITVKNKERPKDGR